MHSDRLQRVFGERLREFRENCGLTQGDIAEATYTTHRTVRRWEKGEAVPDVIQAIAITKITNRAIEDFV